MAKVSVIVPVFNREKTISRSIDSVLRQTFRDFEIIVVDDGSTDGTRQIVAGYGGAVKCIYQMNTGAAAARNRGIKASKAEYIAFLDSDDYFAPKNLEEKIKTLMQDSTIGWVYSNWYYVDDEGRPLEEGAARHGFSRRKLDGHVFEELLYHRNFIATDTVVLRRSVLADVGPFDPDIPSLEDWDLWLRVSSRYRVRYIEKPLVYVCGQPGSLSRDFSKWTRGNALVIEKIEKMVPEGFRVGKSKLRRMRADKNGFLAQEAMLRGVFSEAFGYYLKSIWWYPLQKKIHWVLLSAFIRGLGRRG